MLGHTETWTGTLNTGADSRLLVAIRASDADLAPFFMHPAGIRFSSSDASQLPA